MAISDNPIKSRQDLLIAIDEASSLLQSAHDYIRDNPAEAANLKIRFPRGFLRPVNHHRAKLAFVEDYTLRSNLSYALMTHDVLRWLFVHTDLGGQAREMLIKEAVCLIGNVCESLSMRPGKVGLGKKKSFMARITHYREHEVISQETWEDLEWLWGKRCQEHLAGLEFREWSHYNREDWLRSVRAFQSFRDALGNAYGQSD